MGRGRNHARSVRHHDALELVAMRIAVFDYRVVGTNPSGSCHRALLDGLCREHDFTVYAAEFDNPCPERITWVRVPVPRRPQALLFVSYHLAAPLRYLLERARGRGRHDLVQMIESNLLFGDLSYVHFCHGAFLRRSPPRRPTVRAWLRWLDHRLHAAVEPRTFRRVRRIVVPSEGLAQELRHEYPITAGKLSVISNAVDRQRMEQPADFDRHAWRSSLGLRDGDIAVVFTALGHFERKGLPMLLQALRQVDDRFKLLVIGGQPGLVRAYQSDAARMDLDGKVSFVGMRDDVRPYLWSGDVFALPSTYEAFPLAALEAAAAGLPLLATKLHGLTDLLLDGDNGYVLEPTQASVAAALQRFGRLGEEDRHVMGQSARAAAQLYGVDAFVASWRKLYAALAAERAPSSPMAGLDMSRPDKDA
jgi:glycosyltransferase involved in cell wall biosynthesis